MIRGGIGRRGDRVQGGKEIRRSVIFFGWVKMVRIGITLERMEVEEKKRWVHVIQNIA